MAKVFNKIIFSVICFTFFCFLAFKSCVLNGFCVVALPIETALSGSMNIASEYLCGRAGRNIVNANEVQMNIDGVNLGSVSGDYTSVQANASGTSVPFNLDYINQYTTDIEFSSLSSADQQKFAAALADDPSANNGSWIFKKCTYGYVTLYWLVDQAGNWLGKSLNNIMASFASDTSSLTTSIDSSIDSSFPSSNVVYTSNFTFVNTYQAYVSNPRFNVTFSAPVFIYTKLISGTNNYALHFVYPSGYNFSPRNIVFHNNSNTYYLNTAQGSSSSFSIDGVTYTDYYSTYFTDGSRLYLPSLISSLSDIKSHITSSGYTQSGINSELVDSKQDGYTVPDIGTTYGAIISDIYEVIDSLRDGLTGILDNGLTTTIDDSLADTIADAIADAISKGLAITDEMSGGNGGGSGSDPEWSVPNWLIPPWIPDLLPEEMFQMFRPIFMIVGESNSMYPLWILIPSIIIVILFFYVVISVL